MEDEGSDLHFGTELITTLSHKFDRTALPTISKRVLNDLASVNLKMAKKNVDKKPVGNLVGTNESELQESLRQLCDSVDTHTTPGNAVEFMPPREFSDKIVAFSNSGKADMTSSVRRMVFEVKSTNCEDALLLQMLERFTSLDMSHLLKNTLVFGATPNEAFVFIGTRNIPTSRQAANTKSLYLFRTTHDKIIQYWWRASQCKWDSFLTVDAPFVLHALQQMNLDPWLCRVHLCGWSQCRVYDITLPRNVTWSSNTATADNDNRKHCVGVVVNTVSFAVKVIGGTEAFNQEWAALQAVKPSFLLGTVAFCNGSSAAVRDAADSFPKVQFTEAMGSIQTKRAKMLSSSPVRGWWNTEPPVPSTGGVVVMKFGEHVSESEALVHRLQIFDNCYDCLDAMHEKEFCHTDVRLANVLRFGESFALVDFGEAVPVGTDVNIAKFSEGRKRLVTTGSVDSLRWQCKHDVAMLARACLDMSAPEEVPTSVGKRNRSWPLDHAGDEHRVQRRRTDSVECMDPS